MRECNKIEIKKLSKTNNEMPVKQKSLKLNHKNFNCHSDAARVCKKMSE